MSLQIRTSKIEPDVVVLHLSGSITLWPEGQIAQPFIEDLLEGNEKKIVFDLAGVDHMDSSGVQLMIQCVSKVRQAGGELRLAGANSKVSRLFQITRLDTVVPLFSTVALACEGFAAGQSAADPA